MLVSRSCIPTALALVVGLCIGLALASLRPMPLHAGAGDRSGESIVATGLDLYSALCGRTLARAHARSGDAIAIAEYLGADRLIYLTDVAGVLDGDKVLSAITWEEIERLVQSRIVSGGMVLKLEAAKRALEGGVREVHIVGAGLPDSLLRVSQAPALRHDSVNAIPGTRVLREALPATQAALSAA